jgi:tripartite-type tricarboxylate transporter receptor subunit TctC
MMTLSQTISIGLLAIASTVALPAFAAWPADQPIRVIVPQAAGGTNDTVARLISSELAKRLGQSVVVDNRPGASGAIGTQAAAQARPDGYTLAIASDSSTILNAVRPNLSWDFHRDLAGIAMIGDQPIGIAVSMKSPYRSLSDLVAAAKKTPGAIGYGTSGLGTSQHIVGEWFARLADVRMIHVPYKGGGQAISDLAGGQVPAAVLGSAPLVGQDRAGTIKIVAVTSPRRSATLPDVPTLSELGYRDIALTQWVGFVAPRGLPAPIADRLSNEIRQVVALPEIQRKLTEAGLDPQYMAATPFDAFLGKTVTTWKDLIKTLDLKLE